jgi:hypothetical protein
MCTHIGSEATMRQEEDLETMDIKCFGVWDDEDVVMKRSDKKVDQGD